ncbi:MAG: glycosyltransferase family 39 protein [candidate division KSB1 bacterium]|nr:glycosyltransferase family 39 protein [candidate division KSB1 bacterium]
MLESTAEQRTQYILKKWARGGKEKFGFILCLIAVAALWLRAWGMWFGLPLLLHPDEPIYVNAAMRFGSDKTLNPHWFGNPGNILMYLLFIEFIVYFFIGRLLGWFESAEAFANHFFADPTAIYLLGRSLGVVAGTLSVVILGLLGRRLINERVGLAAALLLAVNPMMIEHAKYIRVDVLGTLFVILAVFWGLKFWDEQRRKDAVFCSIAVGLAAATKYPFATVGVVLLVLTFFLKTAPARNVSDQLTPWKFLIGNCLIALFAFFCVTPFFFFDFQKAWQDIVHEARGTHLAHQSLPLWPNYWWYISRALPETLGVPLLMGAAFGGLITLRHFVKRKMLIWVFPALLFAVIGAARLRWSHWLIPVLPFLCLYAAIAVDYLGNLFFSARAESTPRRNAMIGSLVYIALVASFIFYPLTNGVAVSRRFSLPDTRQLCTEWIKTNIPEGKFAQDFYTFQPYPRYAYWRGEFQFQKYTIVQDFSIAHRPLEEYRAQGMTHLIVSSWQYNRYFAEAEQYPREVQFYRALMAQPPLKEFDFSNGVVTGPRIKIYALNE